VEEELGFETPYPNLKTVQIEIEDVTDWEIGNNGLPRSCGVHHSIIKVPYGAGWSDM
jgi:hypothetical protein